MLGEEEEEPWMLERRKLQEILTKHCPKLLRKHPKKARLRTMYSCVDAHHIHRSKGKQYGNIKCETKEFSMEDWCIDHKVMNKMKG